MSKKTPNPNGKKGGEQHQEKVQEIVDDLLENDFTTQKEFYVKTPIGKKRGRFVDVAGFKLPTNESKLVQVGKTNKNGKPVKREQEAIQDIEQATGLKVDFEDYKK